MKPHKSDKKNHKRNPRQTFLHICLSKAWGGLEMAVVKWNHILKEHGHHNLNVVSPGSPLEKALKAENFLVEAWDNDFYFSPKFSYKLHNFIDDMKIDIVTLQSLRDIWLVTPALWGLPDVKLVGFTQMLLGVTKNDWLHKKMYDRLDHLCVLTGFQKHALKNYLPVPMSKYKIVPNFVDTKTFSPKLRHKKFREELGYTEDDFVVGCIGRIDPQKGQLELIQGFSQLKKNFLNAKLLLVGEPTAFEAGTGYQDICRTEARKLGVDKDIQWLGFREDVNRIMPNLDIFVLPSHAETFGFVVIEAMASGAPVLGTQAGGVPEILGDGLYGWLCPPKDGHKLGQTLIEIAGSQEQRNKRQAAARQHVEEKYDRHKVYGKLMNSIF